MYYKRTPRGLRLHIAILGRRNVGKSSLLNVLVQQSVSIVSALAGTTTDPVEKRIELAPIGPVLFIDTAGLDDEGFLGNLRKEKTYRAIRRADIIILVVEANIWTEYEENILRIAKQYNTPVVVALNKIDLFVPGEELKLRLKKENIPFVETCALERGWYQTAKIKAEIIKLLPSWWLKPSSLISEIVSKNDIVVLVAAGDIQMPKGRIKLPQEQVLREILDIGAIALVVEENQLKNAIFNLKRIKAYLIQIVRF